MAYVPLLAAVLVVHGNCHALSVREKRSPPDRGEQQCQQHVGVVAATGRKLPGSTGSFSGHEKIEHTVTNGSPARARRGQLTPPGGFDSV